HRSCGKKKKKSKLKDNKIHTCHWHIIERSPEKKKKVSVQRKGGASSAHFSNELLNRLCHRPTEANNHLTVTVQG
uniref:Uncharacterized protein n=1 Tax=Amphilophus citrinellus TaxID=61819 RepID=A0A3Q0S8E5_AMPCI